MTKTMKTQTTKPQSGLCAAVKTTADNRPKPGRNSGSRPAPGAGPSAAFAKWRQRNVAALDLTMSRLLKKLARGQGPEISALIEAMVYCLLSGGKRLRPLLALAAAEAVGGRARSAFPAAMAVEMIHCYSLIHDDLPAMDDDDLRRGRPTCHKVYGEGRAILAGDALLTLAFEVIFSGADDSEALRRSQAALYLARSAGVLGMVGGQVLDLAFETGSESLESVAPQPGRDAGKSSPPRRSIAPAGSKEISEAMVRDMETRKTGGLISAALACGAILGGASSAQVKTLSKMGLSLGLAFQIQDDLLNLHGDVKLLGKAVGSDQKRGKATLPGIGGEEAAAALLSKLTRECLTGAAGFGRSGQNLVNLIESLVHRQS